MESSVPLRVLHLVDALGGNDRFWGKENVVAMLMREQRASGTIEPHLLTFSTGHLTRTLSSEGFEAKAIAPHVTRGFAGALGAVRRRLRGGIDVLHSHGYRANIVAKTLRLSGGLEGARLVSTCHGWDRHTRALRLYNSVDRWTTLLSDVTTVPDPGMLDAFPPLGKRRFVLNAVDDVPAAELSAAEPLPRVGDFVAGTLGRVTTNKGMPELLEAARVCASEDVSFSVAGDGECVDAVREAGANVVYRGYFTCAVAYLRTLDVYVQASHSEGLSLSLLEAMRAGLPIVATDVGATRKAVVHGESALIVPPGDPTALADAILKLRREPKLRARLARNARARFEREFHISKQHAAFLNLYTAGK